MCNGGGKTRGGSWLICCVVTLRMMVLLVTLAILSTQAFAWGTQGHQIIAKIASAKLSIAARNEVERLLALEPGETLVSISTWADVHRNPATSRWHYVNFPRQNCNYDRQHDCLDGQCVIEAINKQLEILASKRSDMERLTALKYLVHLVGDVHQPLHAGYQEDKGGNTYQLQAFMRGSNLHMLWDSGLIRNLNTETDSLTSRFLSVQVLDIYSDLDVSKMAEESCKIVGIEGFYPNRKVGMDYIERFTPIMEQRLSFAGARLAGLLNRSLQ